MGSKNRLLDLGSGALEIRLLTGECFFAGAPVEALPISKELQNWFAKELAVQKIRPEAIVSATIKANIHLSLIPWTARDDKKQIFYAENQEVRTAQMHRCEIECASEIVTERTSYASHLSDVEEWPTGWPKPRASYLKPY